MHPAPAKRVLVLATTTGYQTRAFEDAAARLGVEIVYATDRCHVLEDPWRDDAIAIRFYDEPASAAAIIEQARRRPIDAIIAVGDRPVVIAALVAERLGLPGNSPEAAAIARNKQMFRERLRNTAGVLAPLYVSVDVRDGVPKVPPPLRFPLVLKPVALAASRGVMRVDDERELAAAFERLRALLGAPDVRSERNPAHDVALLEEFIPGVEFAVEGVLTAGDLRIFAIFDKPDPLDGPFFEETIYTAPSRAPRATRAAIAAAVARAAEAIGLRHGPIHAECRVNERGVFVLEVAARPIGGLCARALQLVDASGGEPAPLEDVLLRHALGESIDRWRPAPDASGVMMIPIPRRGIFRHADHVDRACAVPHVTSVHITAKPDQLLVPLPEGSSYLGFIFARAAAPELVDSALRTAHRQLEFVIDSEFRVLQSAHG